MAFGDFTVTRSTTKWVLNSAGVLSEVAIDTPAFEFNADGTYRGLLVEPAATNLITYSAQFDDASWLKEQGGVALVPVVTPNTAVAPDGTMTADTVVFDLNGGTTTSDLSQLSSNAITHGATAHTGSVYAMTSDGSTKIFSFLTASGTVTQVTIGPTWSRILTTSSLSASATRMRLRLRGGAEGTATSASIYLWGAQYEAGSVATSYIPTVASTANRTADSVTLTGASSLIGATEGTLFAEVEARNQALTGRRILNLRLDGNNVISMESDTASATYAFSVTSGGVTQAGIVSSAIVGTIVRLSGAYKLNDFAFYINGVQIGTDTSGTIPNVTAGAIGLGVRADGSAGTQFNGWIRSVALFPTRLSNAQLASLTTL